MSGFTYSDKARKKMADKVAYAKRHLSLRQGINSEGETYHVPNYGEGLQKKIIEQIFDKMNNLGFSKQECIEIWHKESGIPLSVARRYFYGEQRGMQAWELNHLLKTFNFKINIEHKGDNRFTHRIERNRLILICRKYPEFHVNMNIDDFSDFEVEYGCHQEALERGERKITKIFSQMLEYYFMEQANKRKYPFDIVRIKRAFRLKFGLMKLKVEE